MQIEGREPGTLIPATDQDTNDTATQQDAVVKTYPTPADEQGYFFASAEDEAEGEKSRIYPTAPDADGYFYEDETMAYMGLETHIDSDGEKTIRATLSKNRIAIVRELIGNEGIIARKIAGKSQDNLPVAYAAQASLIDGKKYVMEDLLLFKSKDLNKLVFASSTLNF